MHPAKIDRIVHELNDYFSERIDCRQCGHCCTKLRPILAESDIDLLMKATFLSRKDFKELYVETDDEGDMLLRHLPCAFLNSKECTLYEHRPEDCRSYPHLNKKEITYRLFGILENYAICPIVFNVIEELKERLHFR